ncbi:DUF6319 family protein [Pseudonocardia sp. RS010]|uniref:DUF6319 family protein n=1 Tax=Pseudonocardia sp. RS010 TaxID=3385979 RepID=UPI0039A34DFA
MTAENDTASSDTAPTDTGPTDTAPIDTGPSDTGPIDTGPSDTAPAGASRATPNAPSDPTAAPAADAPQANPAATGEPVEPPRRKRGRPKGSTARTTRVVELTLTVSGTADGEWQAELKRGTAWLARALPVSAGAVQKAAAELHAEIAGPIEEIIGEARAAREAKVAELEAQLEQAKKALAELE